MIYIVIKCISIMLIPKILRFIYFFYVLNVLPEYMEVYLLCGWCP